MDTRLNELRNQIGAIDRGIVAALAQRSRFHCPSQASPAPPAATSAVFDDDTLTARILAEYARVVPEKLQTGNACANDMPACAAADRAVVEAVRRRLRVVLEIARAKAAGQTPHFRALVAARDTAGIEQAITLPAVEEQVVARALTTARELSAEGLPANFSDRVASVYRDWIIPLARRVQVEALLASR